VTDKLIVPQLLLRSGTFQNPPCGIFWRQGVPTCT
jgi:hypothetical protein